MNVPNTNPVICNNFFDLHDDFNGQYYAVTFIDGLDNSYMAVNLENFYWGNNNVIMNKTTVYKLENDRI